MEQSIFNVNWFNFTWISRTFKFLGSWYRPFTFSFHLCAGIFRHNNTIFFLVFYLLCNIYTAYILASGWIAVTSPRKLMPSKSFSIFIPTGNIFLTAIQLERGEYGHVSGQYSSGINSPKFSYMPSSVISLRVGCFVYNCLGLHAIAACWVSGVRCKFITSLNSTQLGILESLQYIIPSPMHTEKVKDWYTLIDFNFGVYRVNKNDSQSKKLIHFTFIAFTFLFLLHDYSSWLIQ